MNCNIDSDLRKLQVYTTEVLFKFDDICKTYNLQYFLAYGTLLGAIRHKGFIPWDDDIDIYMPRKDLNLLIDKYLEEFKYPYRINHYSTEYYKSYSYNLRIGTQKVQLLRTIGDTDIRIDSWISIFPIDNAPCSRLGQYFFDKILNINYSLLRLIRSAHNGTGKVKHSKKEKLLIYINKKIPVLKLFSVRKAAKYVDKSMQIIKSSNSDKVAIYSYGVDSLYYNSEWFKYPILMEFEGKMLPVPNGYDDVLKFCYGDYQQLPPSDKRKPVHGSNFYFYD